MPSMACKFPDEHTPVPARGLAVPPPPPIISGWGLPAKRRQRYLLQARLAFLAVFGSCQARCARSAELPRLLPAHHSAALLPCPPPPARAAVGAGWRGGSSRGSHHRAPYCNFTVTLVVLKSAPQAFRFASNSMPTSMLGEQLTGYT